MKILSIKTASALVLVTGIVFWAVDVSSAQLFRNPFPPRVLQPPLSNLPPGNNVGGNAGNQGGNLGGNVGNQGGNLGVGASNLGVGGGNLGVGGGNLGVGGGNLGIGGAGNLGIGGAGNFGVGGGNFGGGNFGMGNLGGGNFGLGGGNIGLGGGNFGLGGGNFGVGGGNFGLGGFGQVGFGQSNALGGGVVGAAGRVGGGFINPIHGIQGYLGGMGGGMMMLGGLGMGGGAMGMGGMNMMGMGGMNMMGMGGMNMMGMGGMNMMGMGGMNMGMGGMMGMGGGMMMGGGGTFQGAFNGALGAVGASQAAGLISIITRIVDPGNWNQPPIYANAVGFMGFMPMGGGFMGFPMGGGFMGFPMGGGFMGFPMMMGGMAPMAGIMGALPNPEVNPDPQTSNSIDFFPPALAIIVRAPSRMHTSITGGIVGGRTKRLEAAAFLEIEQKALAKADNKNPNIRVGAGQENDKDPKVAVRKADLDPAKVWNDAFAKGGIDAGHVIATADFLFECGKFKHAAEFLKANLRHGVVVRPWVFEALAVALEASGGDKEEIRRARLSGIALDPNDAQGFMSAARAMADRGEHDRALAFCKQAAMLEPTDYHPYESALVYAENAKDANGMEWAVSNLVSQDWPVDNLAIQANAQKRLGSLAAKLKTEKRGNEAAQLEAALARLNQRDLVVQLLWENVGGACELELKVKEPSGSVCTLEQPQSPGGGIMIGYNLFSKDDPSSQYVASQAFNGQYEITVSRLYGRTLSDRARLIVTTNAGTRKEARRVEIVDLNKYVKFTVNLKEGRRTEMASVSVNARQRKDQGKVDQRETNAFYDLRAAANPGLYGGTTGFRAGNSAPPGSSSMIPSVASLAAKDSKNKQQAAAPIMQNSVTGTGGGLQLTAQVRPNADRGYDMVIRPFFDAAALRSGQPPVRLNGIPGSGN
jgi:hypothetical protein